MSQQAIRGALQTQLTTLGWADQTAFEGMAFTPTTGTPYQEVTTAFSEPNSYSVGATFQELGVFQVRLLYPLDNSGIGAQTTRAEAIRAAFPKNLALPAGGPTVVKIMRAGAITRGGPDGDRDVTIIRFRFSNR
jgi:hypothetical protein